MTDVHIEHKSSPDIGYPTLCGYKAHFVREIAWKQRDEWYEDRRATCEACLLLSLAEPELIRNIW